MGQSRQQSYEQVGGPNAYPSAPSAPASTSSSLAQSHNGSPATTEHVQALLNRVQTLEKKLQEASRSGLDGESNDAPRAQPVPAAACSKASKVFKKKKKSNYEKMKFRGQNHWMRYIKQFDFLGRLKGATGQEEQAEMRAVVRKCKRLANAAQVRYLSSQSVPLDFRDHVPPKETSDLLIQGYFRTFESVFRILHIPSFMKEYADFWVNPKAARDLYVIKLLLVMAIGTCFYQETPNSDPSLASLRAAATQWIHTVEAWISTPYQKPKATLANLEIRCLLLVARQVNIIDGDSIWVSAGSLLRIAMLMGLHRDPSQLFQMSTLHAEHRRRLWATVVELLLQSSMDSGGPLLLSTDDFDCEPPSNVDDSQIDEESSAPVIPKPDTIFTESSIQIALAKTFPVRIAIAKQINGFRSSDSYSETLRLAGDLTAACQQHTSAINFWQSTPSSDTTPVQPSPFQTKLLGIFTNRFLLSLHLPYALKAKTNQTYYFSRQAALETSLSLLEPVIPDPQGHDDYDALQLRGVGLFRDVPLHAAVSVALELTTRLSAPPSTFPSATEGAARAEARSAVERFVELSVARLAAEEHGVKAYIFGRCLLAQIMCMEQGILMDEEIRRALKEGTKFCVEVLERRAGGSEAGESIADTIDESPLGGFDWDASIQDPGLDFQMPDSWSPFDWPVQSRPGPIAYPTFDENPLIEHDINERIMSFFRKKPGPKQPNPLPEKQQLSAQDFWQGLELLDAEFEKSELLSALAPIRIMSTGGFLAIAYFKNRESTVDLDYFLDPELFDNEDVKYDIRTAAEAVASQLVFPPSWFNDEMTIFASRSIRPKLFQDSLDQDIVLWQGKRLKVYAVEFEWALERKIRRLTHDSAGRSYSSDLSDAVSILHLLVERNGDQPLDRDHIRQLNRNGFEVLPDERTLDVIAHIYRQTYNKDVFVEG
ncbi:hypothetical protein O988_05618 [Pseudogymnoascus sp. VKM F-3808]|nr:hypothetical protein O988_05618 [Pseudogymnoascus sp. VKM F-3808]